jgi:hypothetical protein
MNDEERNKKLEKLRLIREQKKQKEQVDTEKALSSIIDLELYLEKEIKKIIENEQIKEEVIKKDEIKEILQCPSSSIPIEKESDIENELNSLQKFDIYLDKELVIPNVIEEIPKKKLNKISDIINKFNKT